MIAALRYDDTFVKEDGAWLFQNGSSTSTGSRSARCHDTRRRAEAARHRRRDGH